MQERVLASLEGAGIHPLSGRPAIDHGAWIPLLHLFPDGAVPLVTVSIKASFDPAEHFALGEALAPLTQEGVLILASGGATHNQRFFRESYFAGNASEHTEGFSERFDEWLRLTLASPASQRKMQLLNAPQHDDFAESHPTMDHWLPVLVAAGAADSRKGTPLIKGFQHTLSLAAYMFD